MVWTRLDDHFITNPKIAHLSNRAFRAYVGGLNQACAHLTDGHVFPSMLLTALPAENARQRTTAAIELVDVGLWHPNGNGWVIHDFTDYQEPREDVERRRLGWKERKARQRANVTPDVTLLSRRDNNGTVTQMSQRDIGWESQGPPHAHAPAWAPIPSHPNPTTQDSLTGSSSSHPQGGLGGENPQLPAEKLLLVWAKLTSTNPTRPWLIKRLAEAGDFIRQHPDLNLDQIGEFVAWAAKQGCREVGGWASFWPAFASKIGQKTELPDCQTCNNTRLIGWLSDGSRVSTDDTEAVQIGPCPDCRKSL